MGNDPDPVAALFTTLADELCLMDDQAGPLADGTVTGLWWYHRYLQGDGPKPGKYCNEERMFGALAERLRRNGITLSVEQWYDFKKSRCSCDMVIDAPAIGRVWIEVKCAWRHNNSVGTVRNTSYGKHLHAAADDVKKLVTVDPKCGKGISLLLVGFDHESKPIPESDVDIIRRNATGPEWRELYREWRDRRPSAGRVRVWFWYKRL